MRALVLAAAVVLCGCPRGASTTTGQNSGAGAVGALHVPPNEASRATLRDLSRRIRGGDTNARWLRAHYLIDLFDSARYGRSRASFDVLSQALGIAPNQLRGRTGTDRAIAALQLEVDAVLANNRRHPGALRAHTLLTADAVTLSRRSQVLQRMAELKAVARADHALAVNAHLRLLDYCVRAIEDAVGAPWAQRTRRAAHCLYPLFDSDPAPYFASAATERPPPPRIDALLATLAEAVRTRRRRPFRLATTIDAMAKRIASVAPRARSAIAPQPDPTARNLPISATAIPYDWTPLFAPATPVDATKLEQALLGDGRGTLAVALPRSARTQRLRKAAATAQQLGATRLDLVVGLEQRLVVPKGDYWSGRTKGPVVRSGALTVTLAVDDAAAGRPAQGARDWDPSRATLGLVLVIDANQWRLQGTDGVVATLARTDAARLRDVLVSIRSAYDYEQGLTIVPLDGAPYTDVVSAIDTASRDLAGGLLFPRIALRPAAPAITGTGLATRLQRRARSTVAIAPPTMSRQVKLVRRCHQNLLEQHPGATATLRVQGPRATTTTVAGAKDANLHRCVARAMRDAMGTDPSTAATVTLGVR